ncbi:MAG: hypothetical protein V1746_05730 [bacterium]
MDELPPFLSLPPEDDRKYLYTYCGKRLLGGRQKLSDKKAASFPKISNPLLHPLYCYDGIRARPTLVVGADDSGKTAHLLYLALKDSSCGRTVVFIDGNSSRDTLNQLYYWNKKWLARPILALTPDEDELSHTWNPLWNTGLKVGTLTDLFFNAYQHTQTTPLDPDDLDFFKETLHELLDVLEKSKLTTHCADAAEILSDDKALEWLGAVAEDEGKESYEDLLDLIRETRRFSEKITPLVQFLSLFRSWTLSSYHPSICFPQLLRSPSIVYVGLPNAADEETKQRNAALGNLLIHHIEALISQAASEDKENRRAVSVIVNQAERFMDEELAGWMLKARSSELMLTCAVDNLAALEKMKDGFLEQLRADMPNLALFNSNDSATAQWFASFWQAKQSEDALFPPAEIWAERIQQLKHGQYLLDISTAPQRPMSLAAPFLPPPANRADYQYQREHYNLGEKPSFKAWRFCAQPEPLEEAPDESLLQNPQE